LRNQIQSGAVRHNAAKGDAQNAQDSRCIQLAADLESNPARKTWQTTELMQTARELQEKHLHPCMHMVLLQAMLLPQACRGHEVERW